MKNKIKREIEDLANEAFLVWNHYRSLCGEIGGKLAAVSNEPIFDVMYQPGDGIVAVVESPEYEVPLNIPIERFLKEAAL